MILTDVNLWIYALNHGDERNSQARQWLENVLSSGETVLMPWQNIVAFIRVISLPHQRPNPKLLESIVAEFFNLLNLENVIILESHKSSLTSFKHVILNTDAYGNLAPDAYLATLAIENSATLATNDKGFVRFESEGLKWFNPLAASKHKKYSKLKKTLTEGD